MQPDFILRESNYQMSMLFHNVGTTYLNDHLKNELAQTYSGETLNKHGSKGTRALTVMLLLLTLIKSLNCSGAISYTALCIKSIKK